MNALNSILLEGNLTRDPESKTLPSGTLVTTFSIASNRYYKKEESYTQETSYFDVEVWSRLAQTCADVLTKGRGVRVVGRLKQDRWQDKDGKAHSKVKIVGEHVEFKPVFKPEAGSVEEMQEALEKLSVPEEETVEV